MDPLVSRWCVVSMVSDITDVANNDGLHAILMERGDKGGGLLMQRIPQLVIQSA